MLFYTQKYFKVKESKAKPKCVSHLLEDIYCTKHRIFTLNLANTL
jgi:hypothetical protein